MVTVKQFKKENKWGWTHVSYAAFQNCNNCHHRSIVFEPTHAIDMRGHAVVAGEAQLVCRACGSRGFHTYASCWCRAWEGEK